MKRQAKLAGPTPKPVEDAIAVIRDYLKRGGWVQAIINAGGGVAFRLTDIHDDIRVADAMRRRRRPDRRGADAATGRFREVLDRHAPAAAPDAEALRELAAELRADADAIENDPATLEANRLGYIQGLRAAAGRIDAVLFWSAVRAAN